MSWKPIDGYEGIYSVSDDGRVVSERGEIKQQLRRGYPSVFLRRPGVNGKQFSVHRLVARAFIGGCEDGLQVNHKDGNKKNNKVENLEYVTRSENAKHSFCLGLQGNAGEKHSQSKLDNEQIARIRLMVRAGETQARVAHKFGIHQAHVSNIVRGKRWAHVNEMGGVS